MGEHLGPHADVVAQPAQVLLHDTGPPPHVLLQVAPPSTLQVTASHAMLPPSQRTHSLPPLASSVSVSHERLAAQLTVHASPLAHSTRLFWQLLGLLQSTTHA